ncbi:uncharacterized protein LOC125674784 isoform X2 [Ostrea edulis]|uniref:uncharacterized protein LOC125674784 isoform X2 n=2 Tax=Ostrea edulis TaxID=37623 RepID=UPI002095EA8F|nr:uncharacterized protein LOC125674784 isoform X2 [Ostrea edulis]
MGQFQTKMRVIYLSVFSKPEVINELDRTKNMFWFQLTKLVTMLSLFEKQKIMCTICSAIGDNAEAMMVCKESDCNEKLCEACTKRHKKQKATAGHNVIKLKDDTPDANEFFCELCQDETVHGFGYCIDCTEPEVMCEKCCKRHIVSRKFRNHNISEDLKSLKLTHGQTPSVKTLISKSNGKMTGNSVVKHQASSVKPAVPPPAVAPRYHCEPCRFESKKVHATQFCLDCEEPEPMCRPCGQQHLKQKVGRGHQLSQSMQQFGSQKGMVHTSIKNLQQQFKGPKDIPGKPMAATIKSDSVKLHWGRCDDVDCYQIRYKSKSGKENWKIIQTDINKNELNIEGLMANTTYIFQVRGVKGDIEGSYSPANEGIKTQESLASYLLGFSEQLTSGNPSKFELPLNENPRARNEQYKIRQICLGDMTNRRNREEEKTIMLVGSTGSGKSTLVDGIVNYVMGVSFEDPFRFTLVKLEDDERRKTGNQAVSQTEWITVYKIAPHKGSRLDYTLNIIDTPGFGDTRGIDRDNNIVDQVRYLFSAKGDKGVLYLDSVCFIVKAPDARLTPVQRYIFHAIMSLFGKDIESNICTLITFADGADPPVLACLMEAKLPFGSTFQFNNSALFAVNKNLQSNALSPFFWEMGCKSFEAFFKHLKKFETRSLSQTKDVLHEREQLKTIISSIRPQISAGLSKLSELREQLDLFNRHENDIENNKDFTYEVEETRQYQCDLPPGQHVTNCLQCNVTCHEDCRIADDNNKMNCWAMTNGYCRICFENCYWNEHKNTPYIFTYATETVTKTYQEMKDRYERAIGEKLTHQTYLEELTTDVDELMDNIMDMMNEMNRCKTRLKEIALRPDPLSTVEHIDLMIQAEESERQPGYDRRIKMLQEMKRMALVDRDYQNLDTNFRRTRSDISSAVGKEFPGRRKIKSRRRSKKNSPGVVEKGIHMMKKFFGELI